MIRLLILFMLATSVAATAAVTQRHDKNCRSFSNLAHQVMEMRQDGVDAVKVMAVFDDEANPKIKGLMQSLVVTAYKSPRYSLPKYQKSAIKDFKNDIYIECISE